MSDDNNNRIYYTHTHFIAESVIISSCPHDTCITTARRARVGRTLRVFRRRAVRRYARKSVHRTLFIFSAPSSARRNGRGRWTAAAVSVDKPVEHPTCAARRFWRKVFRSAPFARGVYLLENRARFPEKKKKVSFYKRFYFAKSSRHKPEKRIRRKSR